MSGTGQRMFRGFGDDDAPGDSRALNASATFDAKTVSSEADWNQYSAPPMVGAQSSTPGVSDWFDLGSKTTGWLVNIFGHPTAPPTAVVPTAAPFPVMPVLIGVGALGLVALVVLKKNRSPRVAGYRRRRSRR